MSMISNSSTEPVVSTTFYGPCLLCGATVHHVDGETQPHECEPTTDMREAIARAYWAGHAAAQEGGSR